MLKSMQLIVNHVFLFSIYDDLNSNLQFKELRTEVVIVATIKHVF
jgi:hypothetical protein